MADENWWARWVTALQPYAVLLTLFVDGAMHAGEFEVVFLRLYKVDPTLWPPETFDVLDSFFADVDSYIGDDELRAEVGGIDEETLRSCARHTLERLKAMAA